MRDIVNEQNVMRTILLFRRHAHKHMKAGIKNEHSIRNLGLTVTMLIKEHSCMLNHQRVVTQTTASKLL